MADLRLTQARNEAGLAELRCDGLKMPSRIARPAVHRSILRRHVQSMSPPAHPRLIIDE
jgi:hypothetical protein